MLWSDVLTAAVTALLFSGVFFSVLRFGGPAAIEITFGGLLAVFVLLFIASLGGELWFARVDPEVRGWRLLGALLVGLLVTAILGALEVRSSMTRRVASTREAVSAHGRILAMVSFFGVAITLLLLALLTASTR